MFPKSEMINFCLTNTLEVFDTTFTYTFLNFLSSWLEFLKSIKNNTKINKTTNK